MTHRFLAPMLAVTLGTAGMASAQERAAPSLWDLINPDILAQRALQSGIMALRTQVDLTYSDMSVDLAQARVALNDLRAWPALNWDQAGDCQVDLDQLVIRAAPLNRPDLIRINLQAVGVKISAVCLPPEPRQGLAMAGLGDVAIPLLTVDMTYDIATAGADLTVHTQIDGLAAATLSAKMDYLWFDGRQSMDEPVPVVFLDSARLELENLGGFAALSQMLPPPFFSPEQSPLLLDGLIGGMFVEMNDGAAPTEAQTRFLKSVKTTWPQFLERRQALVLETHIPETEPVFLAFEDYNQTPSKVFADLAPRLALAPVATANVLASDVLSRVLAGDTAGLSGDQMRAVGVALATGIGAPRNLALARDVLRPLADAGDTQAAIVLAEALTRTAPLDAYAMARTASAAGVRGAAGLMDEIEAGLSLADILGAQDMRFTLRPGMGVPELRQAAVQLHSGRGQPRAYLDAAYAALLGSAAGDAVSLAVLSELDQWAQGRRAEDQTLWQARLDEISAQATADWIAQDMPTSLNQP